MQLGGIELQILKKENSPTFFLTQLTDNINTENERDIECLRIAKSELYLNTYLFKYN